MKLALLTMTFFISLISLAAPVQFKDIPENSKGPFAIASDTQETLGIEMFLLKRESNQQESKVLIEDISHRPIAFLAMLGDFTGWGTSKKRWSYFDELMSPLTNLGIPVVGTLGNHEYFGSNKKALKNAYARFPQLAKRHWYARVHENIGLIFLDTNHHEYSAKEWRQQLLWLKETLAELTNEAGIKGIFVMGHHPPYTNSSITKDNQELIRDMVPLLHASPKVLAYFSGHAHGFEHFKKKNIHFIVTGGAGGARVNYLTGEEIRHQDLFSSFEGKRPFNYLLITPGQEGVSVSVQGLIKGEREMTEIHHFFLQFR